MNTHYFNLDTEKCRIVLGAKSSALYRFDTKSVDPIRVLDRKNFNESDQSFTISTPQTGTDSLINKLNSQTLGCFSKNAPQRTGFKSPSDGRRFVWLELTSDCNLRCIHCYASCEAGKSKNAPMKTDHWKAVIRQIKEMAIDRIQFVGGEPLLHPGFEDLLLYAAGMNFKGIEVFTNGSLVNQRILNAMLTAGASFATTLYSHIPEVHDKVTCVDGSFLRTRAFLEKAGDWGISTRFGCVVNEANKGLYGGLREIASKTGATYTGEDPARPVGRGKMPGCRSTIKRAQIRPPFSTLKSQFESAHVFNPCWMGKAAVTEDGSVLPCVFARECVAGNVLNAPFQEILESGMQTYWRLSKDEINICKDCEFRYACHDCRPMAGGYADGDLYAKTAVCGYDPYTGKWTDPF